MPEFHVRSDSVNVEQIMEQIRARISEKRGVDLAYFFEHFARQETFEAIPANHLLASPAR